MGFLRVQLGPTQSQDTELPSLTKQAAGALVVCLLAQIYGHDS